MSNQESLVERLRKRAQIRRQISTRKSVQEGKPDRIADLLEEAADKFEEIKIEANEMKRIIEIRSAEGGEDAKLFCNDLLIAYKKLAAKFG